jgi:tRNA/tmRNA/rRNA uracil-C5-methylase (TrmA/RlmC/RlmD family)
VPVFTQALDDIQPYLDPHKPLLDFYSGVGAISIPLAQYCSSALLVDNNEEAIQDAQRNIKNNQLTNFSAQAIAAEKITEAISSEHIVIVDPPRPGLHPNVVKRLLEVQPQRIIYLSCNLSTQARDIELLQSAYQLKCSRLYNFFPKTPHIEALCILDKTT